MPNPQALPEFLPPLLESRFSRDDCERIYAGYAENRCTTLRANTLKASKEEVAAALDDAGLPWTGVPWYEDAFVLRGRCEDSIRELDAYEDGLLYLQSLSAMMPPLELDAPAGSDVCDMCAAPGGKTTQILALAGGKAFVTACELHAPRAQKLQHNLEKLGAGNVTVMQTDARQLDDFFSFDRILIDAPCSGTGTLSLDDRKLGRHLTPKLVQKSVKAQKALIEKGLSLLKPGGVLVYSTCSILPEENEEIVKWGLDQHKRKGAFELQHIGLAESQEIPQLPTTLEETLAICPDDRYEGFFVAKIKRTG